MEGGEPSIIVSPSCSPTRTFNNDLAFFVRRIDPGRTLPLCHPFSHVAGNMIHIAIPYSPALSFLPVDSRVALAAWKTHAGIPGSLWFDNLLDFVANFGRGFINENLNKLDSKSHGNSVASMSVGSKEGFLRT